MTCLPALSAKAGPDTIGPSVFEPRVAGSPAGCNSSHGTSTGCHDLRAQKEEDRPGLNPPRLVLRLCKVYSVALAFLSLADAENGPDSPDSRSTERGTRFASTALFRSLNRGGQSRLVGGPNFLGQR